MRVNTFNIGTRCKVKFIESLTTIYNKLNTMLRSYRQTRLVLRIFLASSLLLSGHIAYAQSSDDRARIAEVGRAVSALESFGEDFDTYSVPDAGSTGRGQGYFHLDGGNYPNSISNVLVDLGYLSNPVPKDPQHPTPGVRNNFDFLVYRCEDRIAVFSRADDIEPTEGHRNFWANNNCNTLAIDALDHPYFQLSNALPAPPASNDVLRLTAVDQALTALESFGADSGTYSVPNSGSNGRGLGWFHRTGGNYSNSISNALVDLGYLSNPVPLDPQHASPSTRSSYDFLVYRCENRIAVFSRADSIEPTEGHQNWWNNNNCTNYPIDNLDHTYFKLSAPLPSAPISLANLDEDYTLVFEDNFSGTQLDPTKWDTALIWGPYFSINQEEQMYVDTLGMHSGERHSPFEFTGSTLRINATAVSDSVPVPERPDFFFSDGSRNPIWRPNNYSEYRFNDDYKEEDVNYLSGIITSYDSFKMTHGYVETRAKVPGGRGLWPAFWLLTTHYVEDVPEIDVMEFLGQDKDTLYNTYHYFDIEDDYRRISTPSFKVFADDWTQDFHTFGMAWSPNEIIWYVDGEETHRVTDSDYDIANQAMYLIANLAVGGSWPGPPDASTPFPATFEIDYIRAYERKLDPTLNIQEDYVLQFNDEFNGTTLNPNKWNTHLLWGPYLTINREEQYYVDALGSDADRTTSANTPFVIDNGMLSITARPKDHPNSVSIPATLPGLDDPIWRDFRSFSRNPGYAPENLNYTSGIITSYDAFKFSYGYAEARMRLPNGRGLWPAFWLLNGYYVGEQPEIDIIEARGGVPDRISHNFYTSNGGLNPSDGESVHPDPVQGYQADFHVYGVRWRPGRIDWYIDRKIVHTYETSDAGPVPYQNMYVLANLATGGDFFVHPRDEYVSPVDPSAFPATLDIDYIRVFQEKHKD